MLDIICLLTLLLLVVGHAVCAVADADDAYLVASADGAYEPDCVLLEREQGVCDNGERVGAHSGVPVV